MSVFGHGKCKGVYAPGSYEADLRRHGRADVDSVVNSFRGRVGRAVAARLPVSLCDDVQGVI